jgi:prepilin peptidase CpaA
MFSLEKHWPLILMSIGLIAGAVIDWWKFKVPNRLTFPLVVSGWLVGILFLFVSSPSTRPVDDSNRLAATLIGTFWACGLLIWVYAIGGMGAGDVKLLMGAGAWLGAYYGINAGMSLIFYSYATGVIIGGIIALVMMVPRFKMHMQTMGEIAKEIGTSKGNIAQISEKAAERRPSWLRLPYGVPLTIGIVGYIWLHEFGELPMFMEPYP